MLQQGGGGKGSVQRALPLRVLRACVMCIAESKKL
jgi:hypothetical protein